MKRDPGTCDILINNAGIYMDGWNQESYDASMKTNLFGAMTVTEGLLPLMLQKGEGRIVNMSSSLGKLSYLSRPYRQTLSPEHDDAWKTVSWEEFLERVPYRADDSEQPKTMKPTYHLSKACLNTYTRLLANKVRKEYPDVCHNVLVNCVDPGWVQTDMGGSSAPLSVQEGADTPLYAATELQKGGPSGCFFAKRSETDW